MSRLKRLNMNKMRSLGEFISLKQGLAINKGTSHLVSDKKDDVFVFPLLRIADMESGKFERYISKDVNQSVIANDDDIIYTRTGQIGLAFRGFHGCVHNNSFIVSLISKEIDKDYLFVLLNSSFVRNQALSFAKNSVQPDLTHDMFKSISIPVPDIELQKQIAYIILKINNKISNNNKICYDLESMSKLLYDYWFVQFDFPDENGKPYKSSGGKMVWNEELKREIPDGWEVKPLSDVFSITMGSSPSGASLNEKGEGIEFYQGSTDFGDLYPTERVYTTAPVRFAKAQDVLLSVRAPVGTMNIAMNDCCIGRGLAAIRYSSTMFAWNTLKTFNAFFDIFNNSGTTFGALTSDDLKDQLTAVPSDNLIDKYHETTITIEKQIRHLSKESQELASLRDFLLPMLMNGQVKVKKGENQ